jgi:hypothetical protein
MRTALAKTVRRLAHRAGRSCPACAGWPAEIVLGLVEVVVEVGPDGPPPPEAPDEPDPCRFGPCAACGRVHRAQVALIRSEPCGLPS